jgi:O-antigen/teichoic acid export membrane protein
MLLTFVTRIALARLVLPEGHGLYELALRIVTIAAAVRDLGLPFHLLRDPRKPYGTVLVWSAAAGVVATLGLVLGAPLFGLLNPDLPAVVRVFALWVLLDALVVVPRTFFDRELQIHRLAVAEVLRGLVFGLLAVGLAWWGFGVWSFVWGELLAAALFLAVVWWRARRRITLRVDLSLLPELLSQSRLLFLIWLVLQLVTHVDPFVIEAFTDTATVGHYSRAFFIAFLVAQIAAPRALPSALVAYRDDRERFVGAFRMGTVFLLSFQVLGGYFLFWNAEQVVAILLGERWGPAVPLLQILCFVPFLDAFTDVGGEVLKVLHHDRVWLAAAVLNLVSLVSAGVFLTSRYGAPGMAWANFALLGNLLMAWQLARIFGRDFRAVVQDLAAVYLLPLPFFLLAAVITPAGSWPRFAVSLVAAGGALGALVLKFRDAFREFFGRRQPLPPGEPRTEGSAVGEEKATGRGRPRP